MQQVDSGFACCMCAAGVGRAAAYITSKNYSRLSNLPEHKKKTTESVPGIPRGNVCGEYSHSVSALPRSGRLLCAETR